MRVRGALQYTVAALIVAYLITTLSTLKSLSTLPSQSNHDALNTFVKTERTTQTTPYTNHRILRIVNKLEGLAGKRYYVYENVKLTLPHIRAKSKDNTAISTWGNKNWKGRFRPYAQGELRFYEALEQYKNSNLRTFNISEADFVLVPIPLGAAVFWGEQIDMKSAFQHLFDTPFFQQYPEKHVYITNNERLLRGDLLSLVHFRDCCGITKETLSKISSGTLVKDFDAQYYRQYLVSQPKENDWNTKENVDLARPTFRHHWNLGYSHEASHPNYNFSIATFDNWKTKKITFFYHTVNDKSQNNSTIYRHALFQSNMTERNKLIQPSSVGFLIPYTQWLREISDSKFCIVIRGDNPSSRSMFVAIRLGCIPVIVSDALPYYQPMFRSILQYNDFSISISEAEFLFNPAETINEAITSMSDADLRSKLEGLALLQRIVVLDHASPLFVPAFVHETIARQRDNPLQFLFGAAFRPGGGIDRSNNIMPKDIKYHLGP